MQTPATAITIPCARKGILTNPSLAPMRRITLVFSFWASIPTARVLWMSRTDITTSTAALPAISRDEADLICCRALMVSAECVTFLTPESPDT